MGIPGRLPVIADIDGEILELAADVDPLDLLQALTAGWWSVFQVIDTDRRLSERLADVRDRFSAVQARQITKQVTEHATGFPWYAACSLAATVIGSWSDFDGVAAYRGFDPWTAPVARTLALAHHCLVIGCKDEVERALLEYRLAGPEVEEQTAVAPAALASIEAAAFAEWSAMFGPNGELLSNPDNNP